MLPTGTRSFLTDFSTEPTNLPRQKMVVNFTGRSLHLSVTLPDQMQRETALHILKLSEWLVAPASLPIASKTSSDELSGENGFNHFFSFSFFEKDWKKPPLSRTHTHSPQFIRSRNIEQQRARFRFPLIRNSKLAFWVTFLGLSLW